MAVDRQRADMQQFADFLVAARVHDVSRRKNVTALKVLPRTPVGDAPGAMINDIATLDCSGRKLCVREIALD